MKFDDEYGKQFFFWKSRIGLYLILKAIGVGPGDEVILPGFTCVVVANAILYLDATPVYADIDPETYNVTAQTIAPLITEKTKVIIVQNTVGLSPDYDPILSLAEQRNIFVVDDCAHGLGSSYKGRPAGTNTHAAFFSTQWSKPISTGLGGVVLVRETKLSTKLEALYASVPVPAFWEQSVLALQVWVRPLADHPVLHYSLVSLYRFITQRIGLSVGSSVGEELDGITMPDGYLKKMGAFQKRDWEKGLRKLEKMTLHRREVAHYYDDYFRMRDMPIPCIPNYAYHSMLRYMLRVKNKPDLLEKARIHHIPLGDWFISPLHPVENNLERWDYRPGNCPEAEKACKETVNLFTERPLSRKQLDILFL